MSRSIRTTGTVAVGFHDCRNDNGVPGSGGTNTTPNDDAEYFGTFSTDGGVTFAPNTRLSGGFSNAAAADNGIDFGDYVGLSAFMGKLYTIWADNANCDGTNPNGTLHQFDLYANPLMLTGGTPSPTPTASPTPTPTPTASPTPTATATATPCVGDYTITQIGGSIVPGTTDIGNHGDDTVTTIALPFPYNLYGTTFTSINLSSNGNAQFMTTDTTFTNVCLPWATHNYTIFPYWDDLYLVNSGFGIFTSISGTAPNRIFNIEWRAQYFPGSGSANFELRLYEGLSRFDVIYGTVTGGNTSATAGVQRDDSTFVQVLLQRLGCSCYWRAKLYPAALWNSITNPNGYCDATATRPLRDGHRPQLGHANCYSYTKTHSNPKIPPHTKAPSDPTASSVTDAKPRKRHDLRHPKDGLYAAKQLVGFQSRKPEDSIWNPGRQEIFLSGERGFLISNRDYRSTSSALTARVHASLGDRPRCFGCQKSALKARFISEVLSRAFSAGRVIPLNTLGRCPRRVCEMTPLAIKHVQISV